METALLYVLTALALVSVVLGLYLAAKIKTITYLLEQPVVKKMSPQLKLKPVKVDELEENRPAPARNITNGTAPAAPARGPRPGFEGGERPPRDPARDRDGNRDANRDRAPRSDRPEGEGRSDRGPRTERGDRGDRFGGRDRDRGGRGGDRHERGGERGDRFGGREGGRDRNREPIAGAPESAPSEASRPAPTAAEAAPVQPAALSPRRPLPSTVDQHSDVKDASSEALSANPTNPEDAMFNRDDSDIQHGRRHQPKKKPRFDVAEEEVKEETKVL